MKCILYNRRTVLKDGKWVIRFESDKAPEPIKVEIMEVSPPDVILYNSQTYVLSGFSDDEYWIYYIAFICDLACYLPVS